MSFLYLVDDIIFFICEYFIIKVIDTILPIHYKLKTTFAQRPILQQMSTDIAPSYPAVL